MQSKQHWEKVYSTKPAESVSWFQPHAEQSLALIRATGVPLTGSIIDVGGGASTLVDDLLDNGYSAVTVLDLSASALEVAKQRLGTRAPSVTWLEADVTRVSLPAHAYDVWHDRAVFHFLTGEQERRAYVENVLQSVKPLGHVIVATFAEDGPTQCSGLPVMRYSPEQLHAQFGESFSLLRQERESHHTPAGNVQKFIYCYCRVASDAQSVQKKDPKAVRAEFPISGLVDGWFFRQREVSAGAYLVEGMDLWGRTVSRGGVDPDVLLRECVADATSIDQQVKGVA
jgi:2-polyprenyl-3-methyl-5-hydroxy-6-metoxy-1,4-benzoquinol methylase